ncbi:hypothetical protein V2675_14030, partial [Tenacibaculum maritimum]|uniref:hypothetical protein n=1 Tax=Tenacibaculum maritimum TaxID=107401 RepID=UPI0038761CF4
MKESFHEAKDLEKILKEISIEFKMEYELSDSCFKVFSKEIKVEGKISDKGEIVLTDSIIKEEDNMFSVYKTFLILA